VFWPLCVVNVDAYLVSIGCGFKLTTDNAGQAVNLSEIS
jgi:hypothetical protein